MNKLALTVLFIALFSSGIVLSQQVAYLQYRSVPGDRESEFIEKETNYWAKVAKAAMDQGHLSGWSLWRKVGVTSIGEPNYVFVNLYESLEKVDPGKIWSNENIEKMGVSPDMVETNSFAPVTFDYWLQVEDMIPGEYQYAIFNYAMPDNLGGFIEENKTLWKPLHQKNINTAAGGMTSWGMMSVIMPRGNDGRFSVMTWDGFNKLSDVMNYLRYTAEQPNSDWEKVMSKTKMGDIMPDGFKRTIVYELVAQMSSED